MGIHSPAKQTETVVSEERKKVCDIIARLKEARRTLNIDLHLKALSDIMENQMTILQYNDFCTLDYEFFIDVIFDYGRVFSPIRDEVLIYRAAVEWLCWDRVKREMFTEFVLGQVKFEKMSSDQLQKCFELIGGPPMTSSIKDYLYKMQELLEAEGLIDTNEIFIRCPEIAKQ